MARTCADAAIHTLTGRRGLAVRAAPYWCAVRMGLRVGWRRKPGAAAGVWLARLALPRNRILEKVLGGADDPPIRADGASVLSYAQAVDAAQAWAVTVDITAPGSGGAASAMLVPTVRVALLQYRDAKVEAGQALRASEVSTLIARHQPAELGATPTSKLTPQVLNAWLRGLSRLRGGGALTQDRADKLRGCMAAALRAANVPAQAIRDGLSAAAMEQRTEAVARKLILSRAQVGAPER